MTPPKVSIIVPCWNVEKYFDQCLSSLVNQSLQDLEIILVDDESPDNIPQMCDDWATKDSRIKVIHKKNEGLGLARNSGLEIARGTYVTFCDADDWLDLNAYERVYNFCIENELDICWFQCYRAFPDGSFRRRGDVVPQELFLGKERVMWYYFDMIGSDPGDSNSRNRNISSCMALFRREAIMKSMIRYPNERVIASEDFLFLLEFIPTINAIGIIPDCLYYYRITSGSISQTFTEAKYNRIILMLKTVKHYCEEHYPIEKYLQHYYSRLLMALKSIIKFRAINPNTVIKKRALILHESKNELFSELLRIKQIKRYGIKDRLFLYCVKFKIWFALLAMYQRKYNSFSTL